MDSCKICKTEIVDSEVLCAICKYPVKGTDKEQASYVAKSVIQKSDVEESIKKLKKSRILLFCLGSFYIITSLVQELPLFSFVLNIFIGIVFVGFGFLTFKKPRLALIIPLVLVVFYYLLLLVISPVDLYQGMLWKMVVLLGLGYGYFSVKKSDTILKKNPYLAEQFLKKG